MNHATGWVRIGDEPVLICTRCGKDFDQVEFDPCTGGNPFASNKHPINSTGVSGKGVAALADLQHRLYPDAWCMACGLPHEWEARCDGMGEYDDE